MKRVPLLGLLLVLPPFAAACASSSASVQTRHSELVTVRPAGVEGPLVAYDPASGRRRFSIPAGMASADGRRFVSVRPLYPLTALDLWSPRTGDLLREIKVPGRWALGAVSQTARFAAVWRRAQGTTEVAVVDTAARRVIRTATLAGDFTVDALSPDAKSLFVIQHFTDHYVVRRYDVGAGGLAAGAVRSKGEDEVMAGYAWTSVPTPDGTWLLTLYLNTRKHEAFVHALDIRQSTAICIDLPSGGGSLARLKQYALALAPGGKILYAANPALGLVARVDLSELSVSTAARFAPRLSAAARVTGAVSPNGRTLYLAGGRSLWAYDAALQRVRGPYAVGSVVSGLSFSRDGRRVYAVLRGGRLVGLDAAKGERQGA